MMNNFTPLKAGNLTLRHCEMVNTTLGAKQTVCLGLAHLPDQPDTHMFPAGFASKSSRLLTPKFTWHGFQHVIVEADHGVEFKPTLDALVARWTGSNLEDTASITFAGPGAEQLTQIRDIVKASQLSNMVGFGPTDCTVIGLHHGFCHQPWILPRRNGLGTV
jgi:hypothetical protein